MPTNSLYTEGPNGERLPTNAGLQAVEHIKYYLAKLYTLAVQNNVDLDQIHLLIEKGSREYASRAQRERDMRIIQHYGTYYDMYVRPVQQPIPLNNSAYNEAYLSPLKASLKGLSNKPLAPIVDDPRIEGEE